MTGERPSLQGERGQGAEQGKPAIDPTSLRRSTRIRLFILPPVMGIVSGVTFGIITGNPIFGVIAGFGGVAAGTIMAYDN